MCVHQREISHTTDFGLDLPYLSSVRLGLQYKHTTTIQIQHDKYKHHKVVMGHYWSLLANPDDHRRFFKALGWISKQMVYNW